MMAEGGDVSRALRRRAVHRAEGGGITREKFPLASMALEGDFASIEKPKKMAISDLKLSPTLDQRVAKGKELQARTNPGNIWEGSGGPEPLMTRQTQLGGDNLRFAAEGGTARGALPVKQVRDKIPAYLTEGEYVLPADVVRSVGLEKLDKLVKKYHRPNA
jgi:hypothetical protein